MTLRLGTESAARGRGAGMGRRGIMLVLAGVAAAGALADPLSSGFTYQGLLEQNGAAVDGAADLRFALWDAMAGGAQVGVAQQHLVQVEGGLFTQTLDFGYEVFDGEDVYLEIEVRFPAGGGVWTTLAPRQRVAGTPYALQTRGLFVDADLNVGIGTLEPASTLHVDGTIRTTGVSQIHLFHQSNADFPTLVLDGDSFNGCRITMRQSDGTARILQRGDIGQLLLNEGTGGAARIVLEGATNGGTIGVRNGSDTPTILIDGDADDPDDDGGRITVRNASGTDTLALAGAQANGRIEVRDANAQTDVRIEANTVLGGIIELSNIDGDPRLVLAGSQGNDNGGYILVRGADGDTGLTLDGEAAGAGGGHVSVRSGTGVRETVALVGDGNNNGGNVYVRNNIAETTVELRGDQGGQNSGYVGILNRTAANNFHAIAMDALDSFETGARMLMRCSDGNATIELDAEDAGHGELALWNCDGTRTFRVFGNTMTIYDDDGDPTWSINGNGAKNAIVRTRDYGPRMMYTVESPEVWFEDIGSGQLAGGVAVIELDPVFLQTVVIDAENPIKVFITLTDECAGVYVEKHADHFMVRELAGGVSDATFDYRVLAKRAGFERTRLEPFVESDHPDSDAWRAARPPDPRPSAFEPGAAPD